MPFVQAYHLKRLGQEVQIPRESIENIKILQKQQCCMIRPNKVGIEFNAPRHICICARVRVCREGGVCH